MQGCLSGGARSPSSKKTVCKGSPGVALKIGQVLNCEHFFFVKHQNLIPQNSCILPINSMKTLQINCNIFCMFFEAWWAKPYQGISAGRFLRWGREICRSPIILLYKTHNQRLKISKKIVKKLLEKHYNYNYMT